MAADERCPYCRRLVQRTDKACSHCRRSLLAKDLLENPPHLVQERAALAADAQAYLEQGGTGTPPRGARYCQTCGTIGKPKRHTKGSFVIEVFLWLMILVPGVIYSLWRLTSKTWVCPKCGSTEIIPIDSPKARAALAATGK